MQKEALFMISRQQLGGKLPLTEQIWDISKHFSWKSEQNQKNYFGFLRLWLLFIAYILSFMRTGFLMAKIHLFISNMFI